MLEMACFRAPPRFPRHAHDEAVISVNLAGFEEVWLDGSDLEARQGETTLYRPGQVQSSRFFSNSDEAGLCISLYVNELAAEANGLCVRFLHPIICDPAVGSALCRISAMDSPDARRESLLLVLADLPTTALPPALLPPHRLAPVVARLEDETGRPPSLRALADLAGVSVEHLVRSFRAATGLPPHAWHLQRRIERARHRLREGEDIVMVALELGFADQAHFSKHFRRITGFTPGAYRRAINR